MSIEYPDTISNDLTNEERETHINQSGTERGNKTWGFFTDDPIWYSKMIKMGHKPSRITDSGAFFDLEDRFVTIRKNAPRRKIVMTQERLDAMARGRASK